MENSERNTIKEALRKSTRPLPSNFNSIVMQRIEVEANRMKRRKEIRQYIAATIASMALVGAGCYCIATEAMTQNTGFFEAFSKNQTSFLFYGFIALLALFLLGIDQTLRRHYGKPID